MQASETLAIRICIVATMRLSRVVDSARGLLPHSHLCWAYRDRSEFRARAGECMAGAYAAGQWIEYVGEGDAEALWDELAGLDGVEEILDGGGVGVSSVHEFYEFVGHSDVVDPITAVAKRVAATEQAVAAGYTGFRIVVDATPVARTPEQREAFARFEYLVDREMAALPVSALCAYDVSELGTAAVSEMACLHPLVNDGSALFRLYADQDVEFALAGEIDLSDGALFATTLGRTVALSSGPELIVDGRGLEFIDHRGLLAVECQAREHDREVVLRSRSATVARMAELLPLKALRVEVDAR